MDHKEDTKQGSVPCAQMHRHLSRSHQQILVSPLAETGVPSPGHPVPFGAAVSQLPLSHFTDLEDMSLMVLRTQGPEALFDDHKLILHTSGCDAERSRVFHVCGKCILGTQPTTSGRCASQLRFQ